MKGTKKTRKSETFAVTPYSIHRGPQWSEAGWVSHYARATIMALCTYCKTETFMYEGGDIPICIECSDARKPNRRPPGSEHEIRTTLHLEFVSATERAKEATDSFDAIVREIPSGMPHPDGVQRIHNASRKVSVARIAMMKAHNRLNDYLSRRIVPEDLKTSG